MSEPRATDPPTREQLDRLAQRERGKPWVPPGRFAVEHGWPMRPMSEVLMEQTTVEVVDPEVSGAEGVGSPSPGATADTARKADTAVGTPPPNTTGGE